MELVRGLSRCVVLCRALKLSLKLSKLSLKLSLARCCRASVPALVVLPGYPVLLLAYGCNERLVWWCF
jgi:hypothetical protein